MSYFYWRDVTAKPGIVNPAKIRYLMEYMQGGFCIEYLVKMKKFSKPTPGFKRF